MFLSGCIFLVFCGMKTERPFGNRFSKLLIMRAPNSERSEIRVKSFGFQERLCWMIHQDLGPSMARPDWWSAYVEKGAWKWKNYTLQAQVSKKLQAPSSKCGVSHGLEAIRRGV